MDNRVKIENKDIEILVAEDSHTQAEYLKRILEKYKYKVTVTHNGEEALASIKKQKPDILISDVMMPELNGYELCQKIKENDNLSDIPVILLTTLSEPQDIIKGLECGADHFITKPFNEDFLLSHIQYILINKVLRKNSMADIGLEIYFAGQKHFLTSNRIQILDLLFSTYEAVVHKNNELEKTNSELKKSLDTIKTLKGLIPICANCKKIRNDEGYWQQLEVYIKAHSQAEFTHGLCPECEKKMFGKE
ncbi:response regulator [bacterium]|nr:response regulator [bacterium]